MLNAFKQQNLYKTTITYLFSKKCNKYFNFNQHISNANNDTQYSQKIISFPIKNNNMDNKAHLVLTLMSYNIILLLFIK